MVVPFRIGLSCRKIKRLFAGVLKTIKYSVDLDAFFPFFFFYCSGPLNSNNVIYFFSFHAALGRTMCNFGLVVVF